MSLEAYKKPDPLGALPELEAARRENPEESALRARIENVGLRIGFAVFAVVGVLIYLLSHYFSGRLGAILAVPAFFAIFVVVPVRTLYERFALRRYCARYGHVLSQFTSNKGERIVTCNRCSAMLVGAPE